MVFQLIQYKYSSKLQIVFSLLVLRQDRYRFTLWVVKAWKIYVLNIKRINYIKFLLVLQSSSAKKDYRIKFRLNELLQSGSYNFYIIPFSVTYLINS